MKHETPKPELKSIAKKKSKSKTAKPKEVNMRKTTEFLSLNKDRKETSQLKFVQNLQKNPPSRIFKNLSLCLMLGWEGVESKQL